MTLTARGGPAMQKLVWTCMLVVAMASAANAAPEVKTSVTSSGKPRFTASETVSGEATVLSVNKTKRTVKVVNADGDTATVECGPEIKNFAQIKAKDVISISYTEKLTIEVEGPGTAETNVESGMTTAKPGEKPKAHATGTIKIKAEITAIDKTAGTVTIKDSEGHSTTVTPRNKANIDKVKVGDMLAITYSQALAVSVGKPAAK
jgi:hypothetical protein